MKTVLRALRLPFISASVLPFVFGSLIAPPPFSASLFALGLVAVIGAHLGANLINDYADSKSGADWHDRRSYGFFGGSKLIQEGVLSERWYLRASLAFFAVSLGAMIALSFLSDRVLVPYAAVAIVVLAWSYSARPFSLSYHRLGEVVIFVLFGPAVVMGGYYLQSGIFGDATSILLSLPFGFLTTAILYANEIPDARSDLASGKRTWATLLPVGRAHYLYIALMALAFASLGFAIAGRYLSLWALAACAALALVVKAVRVLETSPEDKEKLMESSRLTIATQTSVGLILIGSALL